MRRGLIDSVGRLGNGATPLLNRVQERSRMALAAYKENPLLIAEHAHIELAAAQGGYGRRQIYELVQNGADAMGEEYGGCIHVILTEENLYCANEGRPVNLNGIDSLLASYISEKRGLEIGRFGLGFKSVLGVTDSPDFFSQSGSFSFDAGESKKAITKIVPEPTRFPILRLAWPLNPVREAANDSVLGELAAWATTIVRLPIDLDATPWLASDISDFPEQFLLFSPHVGSLLLEDRRGSPSLFREISQSKDGDELVLMGAGLHQRWRVFTAEYSPSPEALSDAGELARREEVPLAWAVPLTGRLGRGRFWAFFPTEYETTLSGIVNAPWKTNEDRQNLLRGAFNNELLRRVAKLVVESIPELMNDEDPAWFLDVLPARGREAPSWADELITDEVYQQATRRPTLPDQTGKLRLPAEVLLHPEGLSRTAVETWAAYPNRPECWCHISVNSRERYPRALRLVEASGGAAKDIRAWLEALTSDGNPEASIAALRTAGKVLGEASPEVASEVRCAEIILTEGLVYMAADTGEVFLPSDYEVQNSGISFVHPGVVKDSEAKAALKALAIGSIDVASEIKARFAREMRTHGQTSSGSPSGR